MFCGGHILMKRQRSASIHDFSRLIFSLLLVSVLTLSGCSGNSLSSASRTIIASPVATSVSLQSIPSYSGNASIAIDDNIPSFTKQELASAAESFESYSPLDTLGRCQTATASVSKDTMPTAERGSIGSVKPSGWHTVKYAGIDGNYLYNRCHLLAYELTAENANEQNLITGTRYLNINGMLPYENEIASYVNATGNHVLYRVTPVFNGSDLVAQGVHMEARSIEDNGQGISFNVYCYNVQPGITINYADGSSTGPEFTGSDSAAPASASSGNASTQLQKETSYILNTNTKKFHLPTCSSVSRISDKNRKEFTGSRDTLIGEGYSPCKICHP